MYDLYSHERFLPDYYNVRIVHCVELEIVKILVQGNRYE